MDQQPHKTYGFTRITDRDGARRFIVRKRISEVTCDNCDCLIGHYKFNVTENIIEDGGYVIGRHDFCTENCAKEFTEKRSRHHPTTSSTEPEERKE